MKRESERDSEREREGGRVVGGEAGHTCSEYIQEGLCMNESKLR